MARYLVTFTETYEVEADDKREAKAVAQERRELANFDTDDISVEIIEGIKV
jgi:hypothetical protein